MDFLSPGNVPSQPGNPWDQPDLGGWNSCKNPFPSFPWKLQLRAELLELFHAWNGLEKPLELFSLTFLSEKEKDLQENLIWEAGIFPLPFLPSLPLFLWIEFLVFHRGNIPCFPHMEHSLFSTQLTFLVFHTGNIPCFPHMEHSFFSHSENIPYFSYRGTFLVFHTWNIPCFPKQILLSGEATQKSRKGTGASL